MTPDPVLTVQGLCFAYGRRSVVSGVDLSVASGELVAVLGPSGSGKSTLLRLIAGLERPASGRIEIAGRCVADGRSSVPPEARGVGLVFQEDALFPHLTVLDNVAFGLKGLSRSDRRTRVLDALGRLGLADRADDWPHRLSGGEQQRVAVARALAPRPALVLMDEPFSRLDTALRRQVREDVVAVLRASGVGVMLVTHDAEEAMTSADRLVLMSDGCVLQSGAPEACYRRPASLEAGRLLGPLNALPVQIVDGQASTPFGSFRAAEAQAGPAVAVFRPECLIPSTEGVVAQVVSRTFSGASQRSSLRVEGALWEMAGPSGAPGPVETIRVTVSEADVTILSGEHRPTSPNS
jgi:iron(III) transport system ATP-binding protein